MLNWSGVLADQFAPWTILTSKQNIFATFAFFKGVGLSQTPGTDQIDIFNLRHSSLISNKLWTEDM